MSQKSDMEHKVYLKEVSDKLIDLGDVFNNMITMTYMIKDWSKQKKKQIPQLNNILPDRSSQLLSSQPPASSPHPPAPKLSSITGDLTFGFELDWFCFEVFDTGVVSLDEADLEELSLEAFFLLIP